MKVIRIGTRGSSLALAQAGWVRRKLEERYPGIRVETVTIKTGGDRFLDTPIQAIGGKGIFVKEIEEALLRKKIDLAVHSMKDLPTEIPAGLTVAVIPEREDPRDVLVSLGRRSLHDLPSGARVGTGSLRRRSQIINYRPDLAVAPIRGNIDTRLKKLDRGEVDALILAAAGLKRIGCESRVSEYLSPEICLSAVAQGALGLESREGEPLIEQIEFLHHPPTALQVLAERSFLKRLGGGCQIPVGARAWTAGEQIRLAGVVCDADGRRLFRGEIAGRAKDAENLGRELAERLLKDGADEVLASRERVLAMGTTKGKARPFVEGRPLCGRRIVITRARSQAGAFARALEELGGEVIEFPTIEILPPESYDPLDQAIQKIKSYDWIIFTSVNGVAYFLARWKKLRHDMRDLKGMRIAAIGPETAKSVESAGLCPHLVPQEFRAEAILEELKPDEMRGKRVLLPRAAEARDILPKTLREWGAAVDVIEAYQTIAAKSDPSYFRLKLMKKEIDMITFTSSSTVAYFAELFPKEDIGRLLPGIAVACIGPITQRTAEEIGIRVDMIARDYTIPGLTQAIVDYFLRKQNKLRIED